MSGTFKNDYDKLKAEEKNCFKYTKDDECLKNSRCEVYDGYKNNFLSGLLYSDVKSHCKPTNINPTGPSGDRTYWNEYAEFANKNLLTQPYGEFLKATYPDMKKGILEKVVKYRKELLRNKPTEYDFDTYKLFPIIVEKFPEEKIEELYKIWKEFCDIRSNLGIMIKFQKIIPKKLQNSDKLKLHEFVGNTTVDTMFIEFHKSLIDINPDYKSPNHTLGLLKKWRINIFKNYPEILENYDTENKKKNKK